MSALAPERSSATRQRLPPEVRMRQILDAAQLEFAERGFAATRMDDIARRCGLSKGGLYAHFASKDEVFEALLSRSLTLPDLQDLPQLGGATSARGVAEWLVAQVEACLRQPGTVATFRLLVAESERVPHLVQQWQQQVVEPHQRQLAESLARAAAHLGCADSVLVRHPWLAMAPALHTMITQLLFGKCPQAGPGTSFTPSEASARDGYVEMLAVLLETPANAERM
ncbi:MAG: TetR/AcrR family transcriptional regulator [Curvibacter sp.]|nr:MAG: TetR/AcrR family transcriptional regulator [Curvibacter sp.]